MTISESAMEFFDACETGKGGEACQAWCHDGATFSCQADALAEVTSIAGYADWMQGLLGPIPDGSYELTAFATDEARGTVVAADYTYVMKFDGDKIRHMTKIWNDGHSLRALGWA